MNAPLSIVVCHPSGVRPFDPDPSETSRRDVQLVSEWDENTGGVVGWSTGGWDALGLAARHRELSRLVILSLPFPEEVPPEPDLDDVRAKTLLLYGAADPETGARHGSRWQRRLPDARLEMVPNAGGELLVPMWPRVLRHLAPRRKAT